MQEEQPSSFLIIKEPPFPASYNRETYVARILEEMQPLYSYAEYKSQVRFLVRKLPASPDELNNLITQDFPDADLDKTMIQSFDDTQGGKGVRVSIYTKTGKTAEQKRRKGMAHSEGIRDLEGLVNGEFLMVADEWYKNVANRLRAGGSDDTAALCRLIRELLDCRNPKLGDAVFIAGELEPTSELVTVVEAVVAQAATLKARPSSMRFPCEIEGGGKIGMTDGTAQRITKVARQALEKLQHGSPEAHARPSGGSNNKKQAKPWWRFW